MSTIKQLFLSKEYLAYKLFISPVLNVGTLARASVTVLVPWVRGERGVVSCDGLCMERGSLRSQRTREPSSFPAKAREDFWGLKQQQLGQDSQDNTLKCMRERERKRVKEVADFRLNPPPPPTHQKLQIIHNHRYMYMYHSLHSPMLLVGRTP